MSQVNPPSGADFYIAQGEQATLTFYLFQSDGVTAYDLSNAVSVTFKLWANESSTDQVNGTCSIQSPATSGIVTYTPQSTDFAITGFFNLQIVVAFSSGNDKSFTYKVLVFPSAPV